MKNPPHPGEIVREDVIAAVGLNLTRAIEILGVRRATLSDLCNGKAALTADVRCGWRSRPLTGGRAGEPEGSAHSAKVVLA
jgi:hypothetical protein